MTVSWTELTTWVPATTASGARLKRLDDTIFPLLPHELLELSGCEVAIVLPEIVTGLPVVPAPSALMPMTPPVTELFVKLPPYVAPGREAANQGSSPISTA